MRGTVEIGSQGGPDVTVGELIDGLESITDAQAAIGPIDRHRLVEACVVIAGQRHTVTVRAVRIPLQET